MKLWLERYKGETRYVDRDGCVKCALSTFIHRWHYSVPPEKEAIKNSTNSFDEMISIRRSIHGYDHRDKEPFMEEPCSSLILEYGETITPDNFISFTLYSEVDMNHELNFKALKHELTAHEFLDYCRDNDIVIIPKPLDMMD